MDAHQATESRAVFAVVSLLQAPRFLVMDAEILLHEQRHACFDLGEQAALGRIKRIVEIEHPDIHMAEIWHRKRCCRGLHCAANMVNGTRARKPVRIPVCPKKPFSRSDNCAKPIAIPSRSMAFRSP